MLSFASDADIPPAFFSPSALDLGDDGGDGGLGFQETPPGFGRGGGGAGAADALDFSKAAIRSRSDPGLGLGGGDWSDIVEVVDNKTRLRLHVVPFM